jgi:hypothetical protein
MRMWLLSGMNTIGPSPWPQKWGNTPFLASETLETILGGKKSPQTFTLHE